MIRKILLTIVLSLSLSCFAFAAELNGTDLLQGCKSLIKALENDKLTQKDYDNIQFWSGYLAGFLDTMPVVGAIPYCLPEDGLQNGQLAMVIHKYLNDNSELIDKEPSALILLALTKAFPCNKPGVEKTGK